MPTNTMINKQPSTTIEIALIPKYFKGLLSFDFTPLIPNQKLTIQEAIHNESTPYLPFKITYISLLFKRFQYDHSEYNRLPDQYKILKGMKYLSLNSLFLLASYYFELYIKNPLLNL